jgi:hypothetical protein
MANGSSISCEYCQDKICRHKDGYWVKFCPQAQMEVEAVRARWEFERLHPLQPTRITYHGQAKAQHEKELREELA